MFINSNFSDTFLVKENNMNQDKIGKFIAQIRKEKKLTQEDLATKLGITKNAVSKWERGISMMDMSLLIPVCDILEISITELLNGERINDNSLKEQTEKAIKNTLDFTDKKLRKNKIKHIVLTILIISILSISCFFGYKFYLLKKYTYEKPDNVSELLKGLNNNSEIKIYKRTLNEDAFIDDIDDYDELFSDERCYLAAFRTNKEQEGNGYFSLLFDYLVDDLKSRGYNELCLGVSPKEVRNMEIYFHLGFRDYIKSTTQDNELILFYKKDI